MKTLSSNKVTGNFVLVKVPQQVHYIAQGYDQEAITAQGEAKYHNCFETMSSYNISHSALTLVL